MQCRSCCSWRTYVTWLKVSILTVNEDISLDPDIAKRNFTISYDLLHYPGRSSGSRTRKTGKFSRSRIDVYYRTDLPDSCSAAPMCRDKLSLTERGTCLSGARSDRTETGPAPGSLLERCARWILKDTTGSSGEGQQSGIPDARGRPYILSSVQEGPAILPAEPPLCDDLDFSFARIRPGSRCLARNFSGRFRSLLPPLNWMKLVRRRSSDESCTRGLIEEVWVLLCWQQSTSYLKYHWFLNYPVSATLSANTKETPFRMRLLSRIIPEQTAANTSDEYALLFCTRSFQQLTLFVDEVVVFFSFKEKSFLFSSLITRKITDIPIE